MTCSLLTWWQVLVTSPDDGIWPHPSGNPGQLLDALRLHATSVPHFGFAMVEVDACVGPQLLFHNSVSFRDRARLIGERNVIKESKQMLVVGQPRLCFDEGLVLAQTEQHGHERVALLPSLPLCDVLSDFHLIFPPSSWMPLHPHLFAPCEGKSRISWSPTQTHLFPQCPSLAWEWWSPRWICDNPQSGQIPGAKCAPSRACRAAESSPISRDRARAALTASSA